MKPYKIALSLKFILSKGIKFCKWMLDNLESRRFSHNNVNPNW